WSHYVVEGEMGEALDGVYREHAPELHAHAGPARRSRAGESDDPFAAHPAFTGLATEVHRVERALSAEQWAGVAFTYSDHRALGPERVDALRSALLAAVERHGGVVHACCETFAATAQRVR
ncbi:MAG TPA: hypothetical protein VFV85_06465, partial [Conexibacter sp.]|nr:hypothetical protein [Conexibacter sp.]